MDGGDRVGPPVGGMGCECAGLPGASCQRHGRSFGCRAPWGVVVLQGEGGVGQDVGERVQIEDRAVGWGGLIDEVLGASRWPPGQGSTQPQGAGAVQDLKRGVEVGGVLGVEGTALLAPSFVLVGDDGEGVGGVEGVAFGEQFPEAPLHCRRWRACCGCGR